MPWKVTHIVNERMKFVSRYEAGERMTDLAREFGISRKTGYKIVKRYRQMGPAGLYDVSRAPRSCPHRINDDMVQLILDLKARYATWGAKKLRWELMRRHPGLRIPAPLTVHKILARNGLVKKQKRRRRAVYSSGPLRDSVAPNDIWTADFKGQFRLARGPYCYPLTITDHYSRFLLGCEALDCTKGRPARTVFEEVFKEFGLPSVIRTDNGAPFASRGLLGLTRLSVYWLKLGIDIERIEPGHPEQNGRHERMHLTLKRETARPAASTMLAQQERFDVFREVFNKERPHEALEMKRPGDVYQPSARPHVPYDGDPEYPHHDDVKRLNVSGSLLLRREGQHHHISQALGHEVVGLRELDNNRWLVSFAHVHLGILNKREHRFEPFDALHEGRELTDEEPWKLLPMSV